MLDQVASELPVPPIKTAWLSVRCFPDEKIPTLMRLRISLDLNGEHFRDLENTLIDPVPGNGILCQSSNLTWLIHKSEEIERLRERYAMLESDILEMHSDRKKLRTELGKARIALDFYSHRNQTHMNPEGFHAFDASCQACREVTVGDVAREALRSIDEVLKCQE